MMTGYLVLHFARSADGTQLPVRFAGIHPSRRAAGLKRQPAGGLIGLGTSPSRMMRFRNRSCSGLGTGTADNRACV